MSTRIYYDTVLRQSNNKASFESTCATLSSPPSFYLSSVSVKLRKGESVTPVLSGTFELLNTARLSVWESLIEFSQAVT